MGSIQEGKWLKEHRRIQRLSFQQVNFVAGWIREEQPDRCIAGGRPTTTSASWSSRRLMDVIDAALCRVR